MKIERNWFKSLKNKSHHYRQNIPPSLIQELLLMMMRPFRTDIFLLFIRLTAISLFGTNFLMFMFGMPISFKRVSLIITRAGVTTRFPWSMVNTTYYNDNLNNYDWTFSCS